MKFNYIHLLGCVILTLILYQIKINFLDSKPIIYIPPPPIHYPGPKTKSVSLGVNLRE
jgi:hypothetical protein